MKLIPINKGLSVMVDDEDYDFLMQWKWYAQKSAKSYYVRRVDYFNDYAVIYMHRLIMRTPKEMHVDHMDGNGLNNQKLNLRNCTRLENNKSTRHHKNSTSIYKGVYWASGKQKWAAQINSDKKHFFIGYFSEEGEAAKAYNAAALLKHGEFAILNEIVNG